MDELTSYVKSPSWWLGVLFAAERLQQLDEERRERINALRENEEARLIALFQFLLQCLLVVAIIAGVCVLIAVMVLSVLSILLVRTGGIHGSTSSYVIGVLVVVLVLLLVGLDVLQSIMRQSREFSQATASETENPPDGDNVTNNEEDT